MGRKIKDLRGFRVGRLTVVRLSEQRNTQGKPQWECECSCGNRKLISSDKLKKNATKSCGCLRDEAVTKRSIKHRFAGSVLYQTWYKMISRCEDPRSISFKRYGGRGISVCAEWKNDFICFKEWAESNGYSEDLQIDRINNNGNYEPDNCRFVTVAENVQNSSAAKLTAEQVLEIRLNYDESRSFNDIGREYCVTGGTIEKIIRRKSWKNI